MPKNKLHADIGEYNKQQAVIQLLSELAKGENSGCEQGWTSEEAVRVYFTEKAGKKE